MKLIILSGEKGSQMQADEQDETDKIKRENKSSNKHLFHLLYLLTSVILFHPR
jgi:hypothetical protein